MIKNTSTILRYRIGTLNELCCDDDQVVGTSRYVIEKRCQQHGSGSDSYLGVRGEEVQSRDVQTELPRLGELPEACANGDQLVPGHVGRQLQDLLTGVGWGSDEGHDFTMA